MSFGGSTANINHYVKTGTCMNLATGARRCALTPSDCEPTHIGGEKNINGEKWFTAYRLAQQDDQSSTLKSCTCETTRVNACFANNCSGSNCDWTLSDVDGANLSFRCAANSESCALSKGEMFGHLDANTLANDAQCGCNVLGKLDDQELSGELSPRSQRATLYGACYKDSENAFCAYSPDACGDYGYTWLDSLSASVMLGYECTCADTHTGGCVGGFMGFNCAVSEHDCTWDTYYPPMTLAETFGYDVACANLLAKISMLIRSTSCRQKKMSRLQPAKATIAEDKSVNAKSSEPFGQDLHADTIDKLSAEENVTPTTSKSYNAVFASGLVGLATGAALSLVIIFICRKCSYKKLAPSKIVSKADKTEVATEVDEKIECCTVNEEREIL
eukprot:CAMPEP_0183746446 /NCGR_PEP_ID=MMETSP0737-20130205/66760_1 /TAXON_ID=385413 /ORGANISM="Thalassiosira miniscula, Strain CCMP1093" /LENGTH=388 /DNA_ID=CAMNT_0025982141 /DNA_START=272 /DNA_END=1439 /DNA_ORIENTATION=+